MAKTLEEFLKEIGSGIGGGGAVQGLLAQLGIGKRGLDTPAERDYLSGVMDTANIGYEKTGGELNTGGIMDGVGARGMDTPAESAFLEKMNWLQNNPNATQQELQLLGIGDRALGSGQESAFLEKTMSGGGVNMFAPQEEYSSQVLKVMTQRAIEAGLTPGTPEFSQFVMTLGRGGAEGAGDYTFGVDGQTESYGFDSRPTADAIKQMRIDQGITADVGTRGMNPATEQAFLQKVMQLDPPQQSTVMQVLSGMTEAQKDDFKMQVITGTVPLEGYEVQNSFGGYGESTPNYGGSANRQQMLQYNREGNIQNLGFAGY